jgi:hypothetical protein
MNTLKLNAIASQAGFDVERLRAPHPGGFPREDMLALESFAELIVKECLTFCEYRGDRFDEYDSGMTERARIIRESIQEHFGVEE